MARGHSKIMFAQNLKFFTLFPPCLSLLLLHVPLHPLQCNFILLSYHHSQKTFCNAYEFSNEKSVSESREKNYFLCKLKR